jgi:cytochrome d ubiquinol oxidase subunit II
MLPDFTNPADWLPWAFASLMGLSILIYVILDGFDLGVGILFPLATPGEQDRMIGSIGPFWDANETWLVLAVGLLLVAFPVAHGMILSTLYLPVFVMLVGLILRGVAFEFRAKARDHHKRLWNRLFFTGSLMTALAQGFMLGLYIMGLEATPSHLRLRGADGGFLVVGYSFIGSTWLIHKTEGALQVKSVRWAKREPLGRHPRHRRGVAGHALRQPAHLRQVVHLPRGSLPRTPADHLGALVLWLWSMLRRMPFADDRRSWLPFARRLGAFRAGVPGDGLQLLPLCRARALDDLRGRGRARKPADHPDRRLFRRPGDPRLLGAGLCHLPRQGDGIAVRLMSDCVFGER